MTSKVNLASRYRFQARRLAKRLLEIKDTLLCFFIDCKKKNDRRSAPVLLIALTV
jgi:hypothetical protein